MQWLLRHRDLLHRRDFLKLWGSQVFVKIGENFVNFSLIILLFQLTGSAFFVSVYVALVSIPPILFSGIAGVVADSYNRKTILVVSNILRLILVVVALLTLQHAAALLVVAFILSILAQFFGPAEVSSIPTLVSKEQLFAANSLYTFTNYAAFLIGYSLAGPSLHRLGAAATFGIAALFYSTAIVLNALLPPLNQHLKKFLQERVAVVRNAGDFLRRFREGIRFVARHPLILMIILQVATVFSIERAIISVIPSFSEGFLGFTVEDISLFLILPTGIGTVVGVLTANHFKRKASKDRLITFGMLLDTGALIAFALFPLLRNSLDALMPGAFDADTAGRLIVIALAFVSGAADPFIIVSAQTALHERAPAEDHGRVFGALYTVINGIGIVPVLLIGYLTKSIALPVILFGLALIILAVTVLGALYYRRNPLGVEA